MAEWLYEAGIGEARAALVEDGTIVAARIEPDNTGPRVGAVLAGRLTDLRARRVTLDGGGEALLTGPAPGVTQGATLTVEIVRAAIAEPGRVKPPRAIISTDAPRPGLDLLARLTASGHPVRRLLAHQPDALEAAGWSEVLEEARTGHIAFAGGALLICPTPAMTLIDVDGDPPLDALARAAATAAGRAIHRLGLAGSIGIDFPTLAGKAARQAVGVALDAALAEAAVGSFERTAMNGFGFLQIVRPRTRMSLPELLRADPAAAAARALLRSIERTPPPVPVRHRVPSPVLAALEANPAWTADLSRRTGIVPIFAAS